MYGTKGGGEGEHQGGTTLSYSLPVSGQERSWSLVMSHSAETTLASRKTGMGLGDEGAVQSEQAKGLHKFPRELYSEAGMVHIGQDLGGRVDLAN